MIQSIQNPARKAAGQSVSSDRLWFVARFLLAFPLIVFGLNKFIGFADMPPPAGQQAQVFLGAMFTSYLVLLVGATEVIGGLLLLFRRTAFAGFLLLSPVVVNIAAFHFAHDMPGNGIWLVTALFYVLVAFRYRHDVVELFNK
jgi:putative oxidoreductase